MPDFPKLTGIITHCLCILLFSAAITAQAQTPTELAEIQFSGDINHLLPATGGGVLVSDDDSIIMFDLSLVTVDGTSFLGNLGGADVDGYHNTDTCSPRVFSLDATAQVLGNDMRPADVFNSAGTKVLDAQAEGIPDGVNVDAVSFDPDTCNLVFSVDVHTELDGTGYAPDDLIAWNSTDGFSLFLTGNLGTDIDALHILEQDGRLLFSTDTDIEVLGNRFQDEDVIELIPGGPGAFFELSFSPTPFNLSWEPADIDALWAQRAPLAGSFQWASADIEVFENTGTVSATITRINGSEGSIDINWTTLAGTATAGADYTATSDVLTLGDGVTSGVVMVPLLNDALVEGTEDFTIRITMVSGGGSIGTPANVRVIIRDDEDFVFADGFEN